MLSGMNGGALIAPFLAGVIYDHAGYYAVWALALSVIGFDLILRLAMVEKSVARQWLKPSPAYEPDAADDEERRLLPEGCETGNKNHVSPQQTNGTIHWTTEHTNETTYGTTEEQTPSNLPAKQEKEKASWLRRHAPAMTTLLASPRIRAAVYGCFTHTLLISSFDAILALFVKHTFLWSSTGAGLIFLAITIPSTLGAAIGALSDRYGTRAVALFGFGLTVPSLALLGVVTDASVGHQAALIVLLVANGRLPKFWQVSAS